MAFTINTFSNGEELTADVLNRPLLQLQDAVGALLTEVGDITAQETVYKKDVVCEAGVSLGDVVYLDTYGVARPALARWADTYGSQGETLPANSAYALGVLVSEDGTVVTKGVIQRKDAIQAVFGMSNPAPGTYYLSATDPGNVTRTPPALSIRTLVVDSSGGVAVIPVNPIMGHHIHKKFTVPTLFGWEENVGGGSWTYTGDAIDDLAAFGVTDATFVYTLGEGESLRTVIDDTFQLERQEEGAISLTSSINPETVTSLVIYANLPFNTEQPVVRAVSTTGPRLHASAVNGHVNITLDANAQPPEQVVSGTAVAELLPDGGHTTTPVVSSLSVDGNGSLTINPATGAYALSVGYGVNHALSPDIISLDGTSVTYNGGQLLYVFPLGRASRLTGSFSIAAPPAASQWRLYPYVEGAGIAGAFTETFTITPLFSPLPALPAIEDGDESEGDGDESAEVAVATASTPSDITLSVSSGQRKAKRTSTGITVSSAGLLYVTVAADPSVSCRLLRFGAIVTMKALGTSL